MGLLENLYRKSFDVFGECEAMNKEVEAYFEKFDDGFTSKSSILDSVIYQHPPMISKQE